MLTAAGATTRAWRRCGEDPQYCCCSRPVHARTKNNVRYYISKGLIFKQIWLIEYDTLKFSSCAFAYTIWIAAFLQGLVYSRQRRLFTCSTHLAHTMNCGILSRVRFFYQTDNLLLLRMRKQTINGGILAQLSFFKQNRVTTYCSRPTHAQMYELRHFF
jgi:hypothetical protein